MKLEILNRQMHDDIIENATAQDPRVSGWRQVADVPHVERRTASRVPARVSGDVHKFRREVHAMDDVAAPAEFDGVPPRPVACIEDR
jgi:hypothetical protein